MKRLLLGALPLLLASVVLAQPPPRVWRVGVLETVPAASNRTNLEALREGLRDLGYVEGRNLEMEYRSSDGRDERFGELAAELVRLKVDVIVTRGTPASLAAKRTTQTVPVVMARTGDPIGSGVVTSLARPGGNITGLSSQSVDTEAKRFGLLRELLPRITRVAELVNMGMPNSPALQQWKVVEAAGRSMGIHTQLLDVRQTQGIARAFEAAVREHVDAMLVGQDGLLQSNRQLIVELAAKYRLPAMYRSIEFIEEGGLIAYGPYYPDLYRRSAIYVDKILKGAKPGDLPIEQPTKFELAINLKTAKALDLAIPQSLLLRADKIIE